MPPVEVPLATRGLDAIDRRLIEHLHGPFPLSERPFADVGSDLGLREDVVIDRLHRLLAQGVLSHFGPLFEGDRDESGPAFASLKVPLAEFDRDLVTATTSGLPLLSRPYEAVGAMLGVSGSDVRTRLASMLGEGLIQRIGVVLRPAGPGRDSGLPG